jgi:hypothetical protein
VGRMFFGHREINKSLINKRKEGREDKGDHGIVVCLSHSRASVRSNFHCFFYCLKVDPMPAELI